MKMKFGLILAALICGSAFAQVATNTNTPASAAPVPPPAISDVPVPIVSTNSVAPSKKVTKKKKHTKKVVPAAVPSAAAADKKVVKAEKPKLSTNSVPALPFVTNGIAISMQSKPCNIRAQANINSEVLGQLHKGDSVTILGEVILKHPKADEPAKWVKIALPSTNHVWISTPLINLSNSVVVGKRVNLRAGAGENYSILGRVNAGDSIKAIGSKGDWTEIEPPTNAYAFVAAHLLTPQPVNASPEAPVVTAPVVASVPPTPSTVENPPAIVPAASEPPPAAPSPAPTPVVTPPPAAPAPEPAVVTPAVAIPAPAPAPVVEQPPVKRVVTREGLLGGFVSINTPSHYELRSLDNGKTIDYLYTSTTNVVLKNFRGKTVLVSGEEELDERWPNTPVLTIESIQVVK